MLEKAGTEVRVASLTGEPPAALAHALRRRSEVAFLVCNEAGYLGHGLMTGTRGKDGIPVPVVLVAAGEASTQVGQTARTGVARAS